ncbi:RNA polymerase sigma factor [Stecheria intestinalis]|uniref:RNA polymerase sigma factor n=1 Tax=Stecheria intestinalis TaxID=2606630 RepID=UPI00197FDA3A|nr:sigma factor [Stecheria intestinalis]
MRCTAEYLAETYQQNLFRAALSITHNVQDAEDAVQNTYLKYLKTNTEFESERTHSGMALSNCIQSGKRHPQNLLAQESHFPGRLDE